MKIKWNWLWSLLLLLPLVALTCAPAPEEAPPTPPGEKPAEIVEYVIPMSGDFTGPYAPLIKWGVAGDAAGFNWWNENVGNDIGVKLTPDVYDSRYDTATVASAWPGILAKNPIAYFGLGGPDVAALKERLPDDKVPMIMTTGTYGFDWKPVNWIIQPRPTYAHEAIGFLEWVLSWWQEDRPVRVASISSDATPAYVDIQNGLEKAIKEKYAGKIEYMGCAWVDIVPVDITDAVRPFVDGGVDYFHIQTNTSQVATCYKACATLGRVVPIFTSTHNDLSLYALMGVLTWEQMEGFASVGAVASPVNKGIPGYTDLWSNYHPADMEAEKDWTMVTLQFTVPPLLLGYAVEQAVAEVGAANLTGEVVYNALKELDLDEDDLQGLVRSFKLRDDAPFSELLGVQVSLAKDGAYTLATPTWQSVPEIPKW